MLQSPTTRLCIAALLLVGCRPGTEAEHMEHEIPAHKPTNLSDALDRIEERSAELRHLIGADATRRDERLRELVEIVRWLPEIAGDSDLPEQPWNKVDHFSQELLSRLQSADNTRDQQASADLQAFVTQSVEQLRTETQEKHTSAVVPETR